MPVPFRTFQMCIRDRNKSAACAGRVADILKVKSTMDYPSSSTYSAQISKDLATATADASLSENAIVFNDVTFEYSKAGAPSLSHISFSVKKGQTVCLLYTSRCV